MQGQLGNVSSWIARLPSELQQTIKEAVETSRLARIRRALHLLDELAPEQRGSLLHVDLLSTYNLEPLLPTLELALRCLPSNAQVELAPLNDIEGYISQSSAPDSDKGTKARVILWRVEELFPEILFPFSTGFPKQLATRVAETLGRVEGVVNLHRRHAPGVPLFLSTLALPLNLTDRVFSAQHSAGAFACIGRFNQSIYELATNSSGIHVLDFCAWAAGEGRTYSDALLDFMARQPMSPEGQMAFALFMARSLRPLLVPRAKVLALDLDNTLWGGVVGEDGIEKLKLGQEFPGNVHLRVQRELLELRNRGILLVLLSKNNEADARLAFDKLPGMLLKWDDFAVRKVDWNHKHENLRAASRELGLGLESFAFIDDSDYEREQMRQLVPEVRILNDSGDALQILKALWETDAFDSLTVTSEDRRRHQDYAMRGARDVTGHEDDLEAFLKSLQMEATIEEVGPANIERVVNMLGKTNQFNLTTRRHSRAAVEAMLRQAGSVALALRLRDKFGEQGIVAVLLGAPANGNTLAIDSFLVSCRALGRGVEDALWAALVQRALEQKVQRLEATYIPSAKNAIVSNLYERLGLRRVAVDSSSTSYMLEPVKPAAWPAWIIDRNGLDER